MARNLAAVARTMPLPYTVGRFAYDALSYERVSRKSKEPFGKGGGIWEASLVANFFGHPGNMWEIGSVKTRGPKSRSLEGKYQVIASGSVGSQ